MTCEAPSTGGTLGGDVVTLLTLLFGSLGGGGKCGRYQVRSVGVESTSKKWVLYYRLVPSYIWNFSKRFK